MAYIYQVSTEYWDAQIVVEDNGIISYVEPVMKPYLHKKIDYLRERYNGFANIYKVCESETRILIPEDKYDNMVNKNHLLDKLVEKFNLEFC